MDSSDLTWTCSKCNRSYPNEGKTIRCICRAGGSHSTPVISEFKGPGDFLKEVLDEFDLTERLGCSCNSLRLKMNKWGIEGCETNRKSILNQLRINGRRYSWSEKIKVALKILRTPLIVSLSMTGDVYTTLLDEALRRCRESEKTS